MKMNFRTLLCFVLVCSVGVFPACTKGDRPDDTGKNLHLMGLTSTGGVHSSLDHLLKLMDRDKELTIALTQQDMPEQDMTTIPNLQYYCMTPYDDSFSGVHVIFPKENLNNTLGEYIASKGLIVSK